MNSEAVVERVLRPARRADNSGRPWHETRSMLNGVLRVLGTGRQSREIPENYSPYQTWHRRFQQWVGNGKLEEALKRLARHLHERGKLNLAPTPAYRASDACVSAAALQTPFPYSRYSRFAFTA